MVSINVYKYNIKRGRNAVLEFYRTFQINNKKSFTIKSMYLGQIVRMKIIHIHKLKREYSIFCNIPDLQAAYTLNYARKRMSFFSSYAKKFLDIPFIKEILHFKTTNCHYFLWLTITSFPWTEDIKKKNNTKRFVLSYLWI